MCSISSRAPNRPAPPGALLPVVDHVEVVEGGWTLGEGHHLLGERIGLGHSRVLHCRFIRLKEHDLQVAARIVSVLTQNAATRLALPLCRFLVLIADFLYLREPGSTELNDLDEPHSQFLLSYLIECRLVG